MSRIGKQEISIPAGVQATFVDGVFAVKGPKGELKRTIRPEVSIAIADGKINLSLVKETVENMAFWGTFGSHVVNMVEGVTKGYEKRLQIEGVGFRAEMAGKNIKLALGFSHPVIVEIPVGISVAIEKNILSIKGIDKEAVGQFAANLVALKKPEPYKGKGIRYEGQVITIKQGKKAAA